MTNYLKLSVYFFLGLGILSSLSLFALKIIFNDRLDNNLITLGPENQNIVIKPKKQGGLKVSNLDIEILNNKKALIEDKKIRPQPDKPELLPMEIGEDKNDKEKKTKKTLIEKENYKTINNSKITKQISKQTSKSKSKKKPETTSGLYRVQFGSFRNLDRAQ